MIAKENGLLHTFLIPLRLKSIFETLRIFLDEEVEQSIICRILDNLKTSLL